MTAGLSRRRPLTSLALVLALALTLVPLSAAFAAGPRTNTEQVPGDTAVDAAIGWSRRTFADGAATHVLLGRDDRFPDNLASGAPQGILSAPLLLNPSSNLHASVSAELKRLGAETVHILGGTSAISSSVEEALEAEGYTVRRDSGTTRIETAIAVARQHAPASDTAIVSRAFGTPAGDESAAWADALGAGGWAAAAGWPVLLTESDRLSLTLENYLRASAVKKVYVIGGSSAISSRTVNEITALGISVERVSGPNRFDTAVRIAVRRGFEDASKAQRVILAEGEELLAWAGGFTAAAHAKRTNAPVVLANGNGLPPETEAFLSPGTHTTALWCGPFTTTEACDAGGARLDQSVTGVVSLDAVSVPRDGSITGKVEPTDDVTGVTVRGDCVAGQTVTLAEDGTFTVALRAASDATSCTVTFTVTHEDTRPVEQAFALTLTGAPTVTAAPELVRVDTVSTTSTVAQLRYVFDERVGANGATFADLFSLTAPNTSRRATATTATLEPGATSVVASFPIEAYSLATLAGVDADTVRNINNQGNVAAAVPLKARSVDAGRTDAPDLVSVSNFTAPAAGRVRVDYTFDVAVSGNGSAADQFGLVLADGTVLESSSTPAVNGNVVTAEFTTSTDAATAQGNARRAWVIAGVVNAGVLGTTVTNPYTVIDVASAGATTGPDLSSVQLDTVNSRVTYVYDDSLRTVGVTLDAADFTVLHLHGTETAGTGIVSSASNPGSVTVQFPAGTVNEGVVSAQTREGAVTGFAASGPDAVAFARAYASGTSFAPRLVSVDDETTAVIGGQTRHRLTFTFDKPAELTSGTPSEQPFHLFTESGQQATHSTPCVSLDATTISCDFFTAAEAKAVVASVDYGAVRNADPVTGATAAGQFPNPADYKRITPAPAS